jgi:hypothetical protein
MVQSLTNLALRNLTGSLFSRNTLTNTRAVVRRRQRFGARR